MSIFLSIQASAINKCWSPNCVSQNKATKKCSICRLAMYCGTTCQKADWPSHKIVCKPPELVNGIQYLKVNLEFDSFGLKEQIDDFSDQDLKVLGYSKREIEEINKRFKDKWKGESLSKKTLSCFDYTLLTAGDRAIREQLFTPIGNRSIKEVIEERLPRWGYEITQSPEKGDLVLYFNENDLKHMGLYLKDGIVKSKFGNEVSYTTIHPVKEAPKRYGSQVIYYRKNLQSKPVYKEDNVIKFVYQTRKMNSIK